MPSYGVGSWRMVSAQSVPQHGVRDRLDLVQSTAPVSRRPLARPRAVGVAPSRLDGASFCPSGESGAADIERRRRLNLAVMERTYSRLRAGTAFLVRKTPREQSELRKHPCPPSPLSGLGSASLPA